MDESLSQNPQKKQPKKISALASFFTGIILTLVLLAGSTAVTLTLSLRQAENNNQEGSILPLIKPAEAADIYPEFMCGCCGKPLDPENICCGDMGGKIDYINKQVEAGYSQDEIMLMAVKEFGVNSLAKAETQQEIKAKLIADAPAEAPKIAFAETSYDFGDVSQGEGVVSTLFNLKNEGVSDLVIDKLSTSCGCTSASIVYQDEEGPRYTMPGHGKDNPENWSVSIAPGDSMQLKVYYDPNAHGKQEEDNLPITRTISVFSNDPVEFEKQVKIELNQLP